MFQDVAQFIFHLFKNLGAFGVILSMFIENMGVPFPTEIGYLLGQELISLGRHSWIFILTILTFGHTAGAVLSYAIGRWGDKALMKRMDQNKDIAIIHKKIRAWYKKYGIITIFATRFIGYVRPWSSYIAGFSGIEFLPFLVWTVLGSLIFNVIALYFSGVLIFIWRKYEVLHISIAIIGFLLFFSFFIGLFIKYLKSKKND